MTTDLSSSEPAARPIHTSASTSIRAPQPRVFELYARWQDWPVTFRKTIRGVRSTGASEGVREIEVDHVEGKVPNRMSIVSPELILLEEQKRRYHARFENRFVPTERGTRYVVTADVTLLGPLRWLRFIAKPVIRSRIHRFVLEPIKRTAESAAADTARTP